MLLANSLALALSLVLVESGTVDVFYPSSFWLFAGFVGLAYIFCCDNDAGISILTIFATFMYPFVAGYAIVAYFPERSLEIFQQVDRFLF